jgi:[ribosomal protein S5]-alanine N-acetyltransferase
VTRVSQRLVTRRLVLRRPRLPDAGAILHGWASDPVVTRYMSWPCHASLDSTIQFVRFSDSQWSAWPAGPLVIELRETGELIGSTGFAFVSSSEAEVGYVLAATFWGQGYATEALGSLIEVSPQLGLQRLTASVHPDNKASAGVLEKCGFARERAQSGEVTFPNLPLNTAVGVLAYARAVSPEPLP